MIREAPQGKKEKQRITQMLIPIAHKVYLLTLPSKQELLGDDVISVMDLMSARYAARLDLAPSVIPDQHGRIVEQLFGK
jgi:hypothetical protein